MDKGKNIALGTPFIRNDGANTARIHNNISNKGNAISSQASKMASRLDLPISRCWCIFSIVTVAWSTRMPIASASPLKVMMLIVCPNKLSSSTPINIETGMVITTIKLLRQSRRNSKTIKPVNNAPSPPSVIKLFTAFTTKTDWSNS